MWVNYSNTVPDDVLERCLDADVVITNKVVLPRDILQRLPRLKYIGVAATGVNVVDLPYCAERGIVVTNVAHYGIDSVAEHTWMLILVLLRQLQPYQRALQAGAWQKSGQFCFFLDPISSVRDKTLGLIGTGRIAMRVAEIARVFGMKVVFHSPSGRTKVQGQLCLNLVDVLQQSDVVCLHCPLTQGTEGLIGRFELSHCKPTAILINTARGAVVQLAALLDALECGLLAGVGLDVLPEEPPASDDAVVQALQQRDNVVITPHIAWASDASMQALAEQLVGNINRFQAGQALVNLAE